MILTSLRSKDCKRPSSRLMPVRVSDIGLIEQTCMRIDSEVHFQLENTPELNYFLLPIISTISNLSFPEKVIEKN